MPPYSPLIELRQYQMVPGKRDVLIELFEREFIESQEAVGMQVIGQFRDRDDADRFVWLRGFQNMNARSEGLNAFYFGPVWQAFRNEANATLLDNDNVLLLREARAGSGFAPVPVAARPSPGGLPPAGIMVGTIYHLTEKPEAGFDGFFRTRVAPFVEASGTKILATFVPERSANNFPRLPVREGEDVYVWFASYRDLDEYATATRRLDALQGWNHGRDLAARLARAPEILSLLPTARSQVPY